MLEKVLKLISVIDVTEVSETLMETYFQTNKNVNYFNLIFFNI